MRLIDCLTVLSVVGLGAGILATVGVAENGTSDDDTSASGITVETPRGDTSEVGCEPNVQVSRLGLGSSGSGDDWAYYGAETISVNGGNEAVRCFSAASTSCNVGCEVAEWISGSSGRHPVIAQNLYRLVDNRFEMVGMSWLKHSFCAVSEGTCGTCQATPCSTLGVGCADTYWATLNGNWGDLGPRSQINPWPTESVDTPSHTDPHPSASGPTNARGRLLVKDGDIVDGARYFYEIQYITHDEPFFNRYDNSSWREVNMSLTGINTTGIPGGQGQDSVNRESAIFAWRGVDPTVQISQVNGPNDGRFYIGAHAEDNGDGTWTYNYAVLNMNSDRAARAISVRYGEPGLFPPGDADVLDMSFHMPFYHSGEPEAYNTPWTMSDNAVSNTVRFSTESHDTNPDTSALRWGTMASFSITTNSAPTTGPIFIELFKPPVGEVVSLEMMVPGNAEEVSPDPCVGDTNGDGEVNVTDLVNVVLDWDTDGSANGGDVNGSGTVDVTDLVEVVLAWGACP